MNILNFGSLNIDYVYAVDHMVQAGETLASSGLSVHAGGKGLNQSIALARAGAAVHHAGCIGTDGSFLKELLKKSGVHTDELRCVEDRSGHAIIQVDQNSQNCILLYGGANRCVTRQQVDEVLSHFENGDMLLLQNEVNLVPYMIEQAYEKGLKIVLNPSPFDERLLDCDLSKVTMLLLNEIEGRMIAGASEPDEILDALLDRYPDMKIVLTLGGDGSIYGDRAGRIRQKCIPVKAVDTTAAGDTFTGYFLAAYAAGKKIPVCLEQASAAAALAVTKEGAADSIPAREEVGLFIERIVPRQQF